MLNRGMFNDPSGQVLSYPVCTGGCPAVLSLVVTHASLGHRHCEAVAALLGGTSAALQLPTFVLGRKPPAEPAPRPANSGNNSLEKENRAPDNVVAGMADTLLSKVNNDNRVSHLTSPFLTVHPR